MSTMGRANRYFGSAREAARACDLPLLGILPADPRLHSRAAGLAALAPDPRLSARIYRFVSGAAPVIWVHGLGQAGEELAVAVGIAERAAAGGAAPVLLVRPQETSVEELHGRPVTPGPFARVLGALLPGGAVALPCGIQGVLQAHGRGKHEGDPLTPGGIVLAGEAPGEPPALAPEMITSLVLVVPFRDCPADDIERRVEALRAAGYAPAGVVGYGKEGEGDGLPEAGEVAAAAQIPRAAMPPQAQPRERVAVTSSWSSRFGPGSSRGSGWGGGMGMRRRAGLPLFWWLVIAIVLLVSAGVIFPKLVLSPRRAGPPVGGELQAGAERQRGAPAAHAGAQAGETAKETAPAGERAPAASGGGEGDVPAAEVARVESPILPEPFRATGDTAAVSLLSGGEVSASRGEDLTRAPGASAGHPEAGAGIHGEPPAPGGSGAAGAGGVPGGPAELALAGDRTTEPPSPDAGDSTGAAPATSRPSATGQRDSAEAAGPDLGTSPAAGGANQAAAPAAAEPAGGAVRPLASQRGGPFAVLCGSFPEIEMAQTEARRLERRGLATRIVQVDIPGRGVWCRVVTGACADVGVAVDEARAIVAGGHVRTAMVVAAEGYGLPVSRPIESAAP